MASIGSINWSVCANSATLKKDLDKASKQTKKFEKQQKSIEKKAAALHNKRK